MLDKKEIIEDQIKNKESNKIDETEDKIKISSLSETELSKNRINLFTEGELDYMK